MFNMKSLSNMILLGFVLKIKFDRDFIFKMMPKKKGEHLWGVCSPQETVVNDELLSKINFSVPESKFICSKFIYFNFEFTWKRSGKDENAIS